MKEKAGGDLMCKRPSSIVEARFSLTKKQNDILDIVFSAIENDDNLKYVIDLTKYSELYSESVKNRSDIFNELKKAAKSFEGRGFSISLAGTNGKDDEMYFSWFSSIRYLNGQAKVQIELGGELKKLMVDCKQACFYQIKYTLNLKSIYSKRLYYYLKTFERTGWRIDNLNELRLKLECPKSYENYSEFRRLVLLTAQKEINGNTDIEFNFQTIKKKGKVVGIKFIIKQNILKRKKSAKREKSIDMVEVSKSTAETETTVKATEETAAAIDSQEDVEIEKVISTCYGLKLQHREALVILKAGKGNLTQIKKCYTYMLNRKDINNAVAYIIDLLTRGFMEPKSSNAVGTFSDYEQRTYDYDDLERKLLGWDKPDKEDNASKSN